LPELCRQPCIDSPRWTFYDTASAFNLFIGLDDKFPQRVDTCQQRLAMFADSRLIVGVDPQDDRFDTDHPPERIAYLADHDLGIDHNLTPHENPRGSKREPERLDLKAFQEAVHLFLDRNHHGGKSLAIAIQLCLFLLLELCTRGGSTFVETPAVFSF
jgi:hypothetical protein